MGIEAKDDIGSASNQAEPVWSYRGYRLFHGDFTTAMVHFFRAEVTRANVWRQRLDATTNWAVITTGGIVSVALADPATSPVIILLSLLLITFFLFIESRRYRYYELWSYRVRLMETDFFAPMLVPPFKPAPDWAECLAETLLHPNFPISIWEAVGRRLRHNYIWLYLVMGTAWLFKLWLYPSAITSWGELIQRAEVGNIPGELVLISVVIFSSLVIAVALFTVGMHHATGEVLPRFATGDSNFFREGVEAQEKMQAWFRPSLRRKQVVALIVTDVAEEIGKCILHELNRGVTSIDGIGMYTGEKHNVLLCALTTTEIHHLKTLVDRLDPKAFMIVSPAQEILGKGFIPLGEK